MPYYLEQFVNRELPGSYSSYAGPVIMDSTELKTFRSRPHQDAVFSKELSASSIDPYAYFLEETSSKRYRDRLSERGLKPEGSPDRGHAFELKRHTIFGRPRTLIKSYGGYPEQFINCWVGPTDGISELTGVHGGGIFNPAPYAETGLDAFAQQAFNRTAPTAVIFDAGRFLGELREGLPRLVPDLLRGQSSILKSAGSDYLNSEFGWKPLISDLQNAGRALLSATDSFSSMGKRVHRRYSIPESNMSDVGLYTGQASIMMRFSRGVTTSYVPGSVPTSISSAANLYTTHSVKKRRSSKRWFEGEFTSFLPLGFDPNDYIQRFQQLVDPRITPADLWELAPWSWLVDWNLRIGDTIEANEAFANDRLIMHYGYAMETSVYETHIQWQSTGVVNNTYQFTNRPSQGSLRAETTYKRRLRANPYGFRVGGIGGLSGGQASILGALGLTKFR